MVGRGEIWWADLPEPLGSGPGFRRPVLIIQADIYNQSQIRTIVIATITTDLDLGEMLGNVLISRRTAGLPKDSVINVTQLLTIDKNFCLNTLVRYPPEKWSR